MNRVWIIWSYFDPIHNWHINIASLSRSTLWLDEVLLVPVVNPKRKILKADISHRINMILSWINNKPYIKIENTEQSIIDNTKESLLSVFWTFDTIKFLYNKYSWSELYYIIWADKLENIESWTNFNCFWKYVTIVIVNRPWYEINFDYINYLSNNYWINIVVITSNTIDSSSSLVRELLLKWDFIALREHLPKNVREYIVNKWLYI